VHASETPGWDDDPQPHPAAGLSGGRRVLVTGGAGFIGSHLVKRLHALGHAVVVLDNLRRYCAPLTRVEHLALADRLGALRATCELVEGDAADPRVMAGVLKTYRPTHVAHLAGVPLPAHANAHPAEAYDSMIRSTTTLLGALRQAAWVERLVFVSSTTVYGDFAAEPADEDHPLQPRDIYGGAKLASEVLVQSFARHFRLPCVIVRPSAVYGPGDINRRITQIFVEHALAGAPLVLHDPAARLDFTFVEDAAEGLVLALLHPGAPDGIFNITRGEGCSLLDLVGILRRWVPDLAIRAAPPRGLVPRRGALSINRARQAMGYAPAVSLEDGMARCLTAAVQSLAEAGLGRPAQFVRLQA
jgi:nucleoside-diphosphate-sugar epimerase